MNIFIISDTHWNHENIKKYEGRPDDHNEIMISNWNKLVTNNDLVIHLGDVIMGPNAAENLPGIMAQLNGKKILCRGNHDAEKRWGSQEGFLTRGFDFVCDSYVYGKYAFSHAPLTPLPMQNLFNYDKQVELNIHGHFHRKYPDSEKGNFQEGFYDPKYFWEHREKYHLVQIEDELRPFSLEEVLEAHRKGGEIYVSTQTMEIQRD